MADDEAPKNNATVIAAPTSEEQEVVVVTDVAKVEEKESVAKLASGDKLATKDEAKEEGSTETKNVVNDADADAEDEEEEDKEEVTSGVTVADAVVENTNHVTEITSDNNNQLYPENEMKALVELKELLQTALNKHEFIASPTSPPPPPAPQAKPEEGPTQAEAEAEKTVEEEKKDATANDEVIVEEAAAKIVSVNEDGTKTVEAIEETVVSSVAAPGKEQTKPESSALESSPLTEKQEVKTTTEATKEEETPALPLLPPEEVSIWGIPLLKDARTDTILWKFLRARDFKVHDAFAMIKFTIKWRNEFKIDELLNEDLGDDLEKAVFMHGVSKEGHPVCYNVYGAFQDKGLYQKTFSDEEKRQKFLKWRIQFLEKSIRKLDFWPNGISTIVQVNDLKNSPGPGKWELRQATKQALHLLQDNYPEFAAKQVFVNVPWWYVAVNKMINPFLTQRTKSKFVVAGPSKSAETLFSYIAPEQVPVQYGGLSKHGEFGAKDGVTQIIVKPSSKETVEFAVTEACCHLTWEVRVLGWEVSYGAEFVPNAKDAYTVIIQKMKKVGPTEETIISNTFKTCEPGKVVLTIDNSSSKKKRLLYRLKSKFSLD